MCQGGHVAEPTAVQGGAAAPGGGSAMAWGQLGLGETTTSSTDPMQAKGCPLGGQLLPDSELGFANRFSLGAPIGSGFSGVVHRCTDLRSGAAAACKSIAKSALAGGSQLASLRTEVGALRALGSHPNVVRLRAVHEDATHVRLVLELCEAGDLFDEIERRGGFSEADAADVFRQVVTAVAHCHRHGYVHRDLKPENILLKARAHAPPPSSSPPSDSFTKRCFHSSTPPGRSPPAGPTSSAAEDTFPSPPATAAAAAAPSRSASERAAPPGWQPGCSGLAVKLADFGLSVKVNEEGQATGLVGSPFYVAPEVIASGKATSPPRTYTCAADMWSLGVVLHGLLTRTLPFSGPTTAHVARAIRRGALDLDAPAWHLISPAAKRLVRRLLCLDPQKRLTAEEALHHPWLAGPRSPDGPVLLSPQGGAASPGRGAEGSPLPSPYAAETAVSHPWLAPPAAAADTAVAAATSPRRCCPVRSSSASRKGGGGRLLLASPLRPRPGKLPQAPAGPREELPEKSHPASAASSAAWPPPGAGGVEAAAHKVRPQELNNKAPAPLLSPGLPPPKGGVAPLPASPTGPLTPRSVTPSSSGGCPSPPSGSPSPRSHPRGINVPPHRLLTAALAALPSEEGSSSSSVAPAQPSSRDSSTGSAHLDSPEPQLWGPPRVPSPGAAEQGPPQCPPQCSSARLMSALRHMLDLALAAGCLGPEVEEEDPSMAPPQLRAADGGGGGGGGSCGPSPRDIRKRKGNAWWGAEEGACGAPVLAAM